MSAADDILTMIDQAADQGFKTVSRNGSVAIYPKDGKTPPVWVYPHGGSGRTLDNNRAALKRIGVIFPDSRIKKQITGEKMAPVKVVQVVKTEVSTTEQLVASIGRMADELATIETLAAKLVKEQEPLKNLAMALSQFGKST